MKLGFIKSVSAGLDPNKVELAKLFLKFANTNESIAEFLKVSNFSRAMEYTLTDEQYDDLSLYARNVYETHKGTQFLVPYGDNKTFINNSTRLLETGEILASRIDGFKYDDVADTLVNYRNINAIEYFRGMVEYHNAAYWAAFK